MTKPKLSAPVIQREIEREVGLPVQFRMSRHYCIESDRWETRVSFSARGHGAETSLSDADLDMALQAFSTRIVAPMVAIWRSGVQA